MTDKEKIQYLIDFEKEIEEIYKTGIIRGPIHLRGGNEEQLVNIFKTINQKDIVLATWANHLEALLHGVPREKVKQRILDGQSMAMNFPEYHFYTSAIVSGISPIGVGIAYAIKRQKDNHEYLDLQSDQNHKYVNIFLGDMAFQNGLTLENIRYSINHDLPIRWIIGDNNLSVSTITDETWRGNIRELVKFFKSQISFCKYTQLYYYSYKNIYPHSGCGSFISF